ncbi:polyketide synthase [Penicillium chermesinum]|nr:polyketide synthase [Penicillium chermesinum]
MQLPAEVDNKSNGSSLSWEPVLAEDQQAIAIIGMGEWFSTSSSRDYRSAYIGVMVVILTLRFYIVGCRLPGDIKSPTQMWDFLAQGKCAAGPVPQSRFNNEAYRGGGDEPGTSLGPGGYFLKDDIRQFDNQFFGINNREAVDMDPEQRSLLEVVFECFESAGYSLGDLSGADVGCYVATFLQDHASIISKDVEYLTRYSATGIGAAIIANRISHIFNLKGPSCSINTACSASIYALHQAVSALRNQECDSAVVAGVNLIHSPDLHVAVSQGGVLSPTSVCHTFDESADGYGRAEAVNALYIKRLGDAIRDGDPIRSIIRGTAVNSNGRTPGITQPSIDGQIAVARKAYDQAGLKPSDTAYVEMHGTGTAVGDVMEAKSVAGVFSVERQGRPLFVGGLKPNLGHAEAASGLSSVIKATLALERKQVPPTFGVVNLNPKLQLEEHGIQLVRQFTQLPDPSPGSGRRISVNSFGFGGANAHAIFEEAGPYAKFSRSCLKEEKLWDVPNTLDCDRPYLLPFSAHDGVSLERRVDQLGRLNLPADIMTDLAYTLSERRSHLKSRGFVIARGDTLNQDLNAENLRVASPAGPIISLNQRFVLVFTGQGAQWQGMAEELLQTPVFAHAISQMDEALASLPYPPSWTIAGILQDKTDHCPINEAAFAQPVTTAVQIGLVELLKAFRVPMDGVLGHSSGEIAAAYAANLLDMHEAIALAYYRGYAVTECAPIGAMAAVGLPSDKVEDWIQRQGTKEHQVRVACINSPESVTVSGDADGIDALVSCLTANGTFARKLKTGGKAYHSHQMKPVGSTYERLLREANIFSSAPAQGGKVDSKPCMFSTVLRQQVAESDVRTAAYWRQNLESPVHFSDGLLSASALWDEVCCLEVGPHTALKMPILQTLGKSTPYFGTLQRGKGSLNALLELAGNLFLSEFPIPFPQLQLLWNESRISREVRERKFPRHELLGTPVPGGNLITYGWRNRLSLDNVPWLKDHKLGDTIVFPATSYLSMAAEALLQVRGVQVNQDLAAISVCFQNVDLPNALPIGERETIELYTELSSRELSNLTSYQDWYDFKVVSIADDTPTIRARGTIKLLSGPPDMDERNIPYAEGQLVSKSPRMWYESMDKCGLRYGPNFQHMQNILTPDTSDVLYAQAKLENIRPQFQAVQPSPRYLIHPAIWDNALQIGLVASAGGNFGSMVAKVPKSFGRISVTAASLTSHEGMVCATSTVTGFTSNDVNTALLDSNHRALMSVEKMCITKYSGGDEMAEVRHPLYRFVWKPDFDQIPSDAAFAAALQHVSDNTDLGLLLRTDKRILMAMDLAVHKDPSADILFITSDLWLIRLALSDILKAHTGHQRFNSFHLGRFKPDGQLEVAELQRYALPVEMDSFSPFAAPAPNQRFGLVVLSEGTPHLDRLASYTNNFARIIDGGYVQGEALPCEKFTVSHALPGTLITDPGIRILRPVRRDNQSGSHQFEKILLISRTPSRVEDDTLRDCLAADLSLPVDKHELTELTNVDIEDTTLVVSTAELERDVTARATREEYAAIQRVLSKPVRMVWISGSGIHEDGDPTRAVFHGLARAIMIEQPAAEIYSLELYPNAQPADISRYVAGVITRPEGCPPDYEYLQSEAGLLVSRGVPDEPMNAYFRRKEQGRAIMDSLDRAGPVSLSMEKPGQLNSVQFVKTPQANLGQDDVLVQVSWIGLNAKDVYALAGRVQTPGATCSGEFTGTILAVGSAVTNLTVNDHVAVLFPGHFSSHEVVPAHNCVKLDPQDDLRSFASVLVVFATALYALENRARLQPGESVLIHSAAGGVGIAAIQVAKMIGAEIFATVGTEEKKKYLVETFGLQPDHILSSRSPGFADQIRSVTKGHGVDVVLNSLVGELLLESWDCLAEFGRFVEIGKKDITDHGRLPMDPFGRGATFTAFDLALLSTSHSLGTRRCFRQLFSRVIELVHSGVIQPVPLKSFTAGELLPAFRYFNDPARIGKVVVSFEDPNTMIPVVPAQFATQLHPDKCYFMVGNFLFLGRSGTRKPAARRLVEDLEQQGARCIVIEGDVTNADDVERAASAAELPLGGVIHAAMGLHEAIFSEMSHEAWREGTAAKIEGAWNLHNALSKSNRESHLDFFIMTSSINGKIGTATESNYCAANNFLDVFARYRQTLGRPALSLGLGAIAEVGYLHEHSHIEELLLRKGIRFLTESDVLQIFDLALSKSPTAAHPSDKITSSLLLSGVEVTTLQRYHQQGFKTFWHSLTDVRFAILINALRRSSGNTAGQGDSHEFALRNAVAAKDPALVLAAAQETITQKLSYMVLVPADKINVHASLADFAMDSMLASELRQHIFSVANVDISFLTIMSPQTSVSTMASMVASALLQRAQENS